MSVRIHIPGWFYDMKRKHIIAKYPVTIRLRRAHPGSGIAVVRTFLVHAKLTTPAFGHAILDG
ncbi:MAG: hypothetical protein AAF756_12340 [Pseudomonadota bacterium]